MANICLGAFATQQDAEAAKAARPEAQEELTVVEDGDVEHPWRVWWNRAD